MSRSRTDLLADRLRDLQVSTDVETSAIVSVDGLIIASSLLAGSLVTKLPPPSWLRKFQNWHHPKNHEYDGEINETLDNYFSGTTLPSRQTGGLVFLEMRRAVEDLEKLV